MKRIALLYLLILTSFMSYAQNNNPNYDAELAASLEADDYGMKNYVFVILKTGSNKNDNEDLRNNAFRGHMSNISRLVEDDKLVVAGPFGKNDLTYRGLFILKVTTIEEAEKLLETDPAIKGRYLDAELIEWYGSAALSQYLLDSDKVWKIKP